MGRFFLTNNKIYDDIGEIPTIDLENIDGEELEYILNYLESDKLEYKRQLNTLKYRIQKMVE